MKRSQMNRAIQTALDFFEAHHFKLPPWAAYSPDKWSDLGKSAEEVKKHGLGWIVTDFGSANFKQRGLIIFVLRNGLLDETGEVSKEPIANKTYAEKVMMSLPGQVTPWHFHWKKTEDLINRAGGRLQVELAWATDDDLGLKTDDVHAQVDGVTCILKHGDILTLNPGESVTLPPRLAHKFYGHPEDPAGVLVGEVSSLNDDFTDNCFIEKFESSIVEDEPAKFAMRYEYDLVCC